MWMKFTFAHCLLSFRDVHLLQEVLCKEVMQAKYQDTEQQKQWVGVLLINSYNMLTVNGLYADCVMLIMSLNIKILSVYVLDVSIESELLEQT